MHTLAIGLFEDENVHEFKLGMDNAIDLFNFMLRMNSQNISHMALRNPQGKRLRWAISRWMSTNTWVLAEESPNF